jgi:hypothetical protein
MAKKLNYYDNWKHDELLCKNCGWKGFFEDGSVEYYKEMMEASCPACDCGLAIVQYPTIIESEENWDKLSDGEKQEVCIKKGFIESWEASKLKTAESLPDLEGSALTLIWDFEESVDHANTVIKLDDKVLWCENACYEGAGRFKEIVEILKEKYGSRLVDVVPTGNSKEYLYGDDMSAPHIVNSIRESLKKHFEDGQKHNKHIKD